MLILQLWFTASILVAAFWALAGLLIGTPDPAPQGGESGSQPSFECPARSEAA
jgi:hypothetical protein